MTVRFFSIENVNNSGGNDIAINQITELNVIAPHETIIPIPFTDTFYKLPLEVFKLQDGEKGKVETICNFNNADSTDFKLNKYVVFDGVMKLKMDYELPTILTTTQNVYEFDFTKFNNFKKVIQFLSEFDEKTKNEFLIKSSNKIKILVDNELIDTDLTEPLTKENFNEYGITGLQPLIEPKAEKSKVMIYQSILQD